MTLGYQSDVRPIRRLLLRHARDAFVSDESIGEQWQNLAYLSRPDFARAIDEYDRFVSLLNEFDIEISFVGPAKGATLDSLYVRDAAIACSKGMILCNMGKAPRRAEPQMQEAAYRALEIPIHGAINGDGCVEGGDVAWIDERTLAVGRGYRTNDAGIQQLRTLLSDCIDELIVVPLPHWRGPNDVFHLMSVFSPIDDDLALVYSPLMPVTFREALLGRGMSLVEVPESEFESMGCNVLAVAPRQCVMLAGNPETKAGLEKAGATVRTYEGHEISAKGAGGPTCLTRPILREMSR